MGDNDQRNSHDAELVEALVSATSLTLKMRSNDDRRKILILHGDAQDKEAA